MFRTVLVPVDFSPPSLQAVRHAGEVVRAVGGWLNLLHVLEEDDPDHTRAELARARLLELGALNRRTPKLILEHLGEENVAEAILRVARREGADLMILGPHGGSGLSEARLGRVVQRILLVSHIPVQLVPERLEPPSSAGSWSRVVSRD